jgi:hypothetical protein
MNRYLIFADLLGTSKAYVSPKDVVRRRQILEQAIDAFFIPILEEDDIYIYVFSDTLVATCPNLNKLLKPSAKLFEHFLKLTMEKENPVQLMLMRGAISNGSPEASIVLKPSARVITIPILDESFPKAYKLEGLRKGSRIFLDPGLPEVKIGSELKKLSSIKWISITGHGQPLKGVGEFLWPLFSSRNTASELSRTLIKINKIWLKLLRSKEWAIDEYDNSLLHLDETMKLFIRSLALLPTTAYIQNIIFSLLPEKKSSLINVKFEWGTWFQVLKVIVEAKTCFISLPKLKSKIKLIKNIMKEDFYGDSFLTELEKPDYLNFKNKLEQFWSVE